MAQANQKPKTVLNSPKLRLSAPCPTAKGKYSNLSFDMYMNNPRVVIATNDPALMSPEKGYGRIQAALDMPTMFAFFQMIKDVIKSPTATKSKIENFGNQKGGDPKVPVHLTDLWIGRDDSGVIFISVVSKQEGYPVIKFTFGPSDARFHKYMHGDGTEYTKAEVSNLYARAFVTLLEEALGNLAVSTYVHPEPYQKGGFNKGGNGGGYNKPSSAPAASDDDTGDDIPW